MQLIIFALFFILFVPSIGRTLENLDELEARASRKSANTFYSGEDSGNYYIWQPQTTIYTDSSTGHEVILWSRTADQDTMRAATEYGWQPWSADGKRISFVQTVTVGNYTVSSGSPWFVSHSDGTYWRPLAESPNRTDVRRPYFDWSPVEPDVAYAVGYNYNGVTGLDMNAIYKNTITDTGGSYVQHVDLISGDTTTQRLGGIKHAITGDGKYYLTSLWAENEPFFIAEITGTPQLTLTYNQPSLDTYWFSTPASGQGDWHDEGFSGNASEGYWIYILHTAADWWRMRPWGTDSGTPNHTVDNSDPYDWWTGTDAQKEIQAVNGNTGNATSFFDSYWSHGTVDQWGTYIVYSDVDNPGGVGPGVFDVNNATQTGVWDAAGVQYNTWNAWSDYTAHSITASGSHADSIGSLLYNSLNSGDHIEVANLHSATINDFTAPGQSPDGTKIAMRSDWLNPTASQSDLFIGVVYYPYPPEVKTVEATGGTVTVEVWWNLGTTPRGYTTRGWPDEDVDDPPPPREIEKFRLWRCQGTCTATSGTWVDIGTFTNTIWDDYDFADGTWNSGTEADNTWTDTDTPGDGTWYYAVTSVEYSGLESHSLSNIFSITVSSGSGSGSQSVAYPAAPGGDNDFVTTFDSDQIRYYNIYANDGSAPSISQTNLAASVPVGYGTSYVDWLGNTDGSTEYVVTAVDYQGNESGALSSSSTHQLAPATAAGQYTVTWENNDVTQPTLLSAAVNDQTVSIVFSETVTDNGVTNEFTLTCDVSGAQTITIVSGSGNANWQGSVPSGIANGETCTAAFTTSADLVEDDAGNDLDTFTGFSVDVNTPAEAPAVVYPAKAGLLGGGQGAYIGSGNGAAYLGN